MKLMTAVATRLAGPVRWADHLLSQGRRLLVVVATLVILLVAALIAGGLLVHNVHEQQRLEQARTDGLRAASQLTRQLLSYDYRSLHEDLAKADQITTPDFARKFDDLANELIRPNAREKKIVTTAEIAGSAVVSISSDEIVALLFINQSTTGTDQSLPRIDRSRARVTMTRVDDRWLISDLMPI